MKAAFALLPAAGTLLVASAAFASESANPVPEVRPPAPSQPSERIQLLDPTNIEGEIRLPQVLFITSHESVRPLDYLEYYAAHRVRPAADSLAGPGVLHVIRSIDDSTARSDSSGGAGQRAPQEGETP